MYTPPQQRLPQQPADADVACAQGILGYSEGATAAATLILEESRLLQQEGRPRRIKVCHAGFLPLPAP